jgi:hypothetical protein
VRWNDGQVTFFSGGEKHERFRALFDHVLLAEGFARIGQTEVVVYGEAYGGSQQGQSHRYGKELKFVAFDVKMRALEEGEEYWLPVPAAEEVVKNLGLEFVHYVKVSTDLAALDAERDAPSEQARRNGVEGVHPREGVVLRPLMEVTKNNQSRIISKHKRDDERETATPRKVVDPTKIQVLLKADEVAVEWVTPTRLQHVLDKVGPDSNVEQTGDVIRAMLEDVKREGAGEIVWGKETNAAIGKKTREIFMAHLKARLEAAAHG